MITLAQKDRTISNFHPILIDLFLITLAYTLAHGLILFNHGVFWDDWVVYNMDNVLIIDRFKQAGLEWFAYLHIILSSKGVIAYRIVTFLCYLLSAWCLYGILNELKIDRYSRFFLVAFFALFPVCITRTAIVSIQYTICYPLFFMGFWLTTRQLQTRSDWYRLPALALLFLSFNMNSLLVFYLIVILYIMYMEQPANKSCSNWLRLVPRYADYLLLPILFWILKNTYMKSYGWCDDYNRVTLNGISLAIADTFRAFDTSFLAVIDRSTGYPFFSKVLNKTASIGTYIPFIVIAVVVIATLIRFRYQKNADRELFEAPGLFLLGGFIFWLAAFPYVAVGKLPQLHGMESRHQLLIPLGASLMLVYGVKLLSRRRFITLPIYLVLMSIFVHTTVLNHISFQGDWYKQLSIMEGMSKSPSIRDGTSFLFKDETLDLNYNYRSYYFYEYAGIMKKVFKDERRFGDDLQSYTSSYKKDIQNYKKYKAINASYNLGEFEIREPDTLITIRRGPTKLATADVLKMMYWERSDKERFSRAIADIVSFEVGTL